MNSLTSKILLIAAMGALVAKAQTYSVTNLPVKSDAEITALIIKERREKLNKELRSVGGRQKHHGKLVMQEIDDTNRLVKIERYADGTVYEIPFRNPTPRDRFKKRTEQMRRSKSILPGVDKAREQNVINRNSVSNVTVNINVR